MRPHATSRCAEQRFLGLDLAWSTRNPSGVAALDGDGRVVDARADLRSDADILTWVRSSLGATTAIGLDMPTIVRNRTGARACERELGTDFRRYHAGPHPANLGRFPDGGRARRLLDALRDDGVIERLALGPRTAGRFAFEVFPHPAHVRLFGLERIFQYKKKRRPWPLVLAEWSRYRSALAGLSRAEPPLAMPDWIPSAVAPRGYKRWDDLLDALTCAYVASYVWHWGMAAPRTRVYGDLEDGYIVVPEPPNLIIASQSGEGLIV
jgi:predicted RNase H-like nuclease